MGFLLQKVLCKLGFHAWIDASGKRWILPYQYNECSHLVCERAYCHAQTPSLSAILKSRRLAKKLSKNRRLEEKYAKKKAALQRRATIHGSKMRAGSGLLIGPNTPESQEFSGSEPRKISPDRSQHRDKSEPAIDIAMQDVVRIRPAKLRASEETSCSGMRKTLISTGPNWGEELRTVIAEGWPRE